MERVFRLPHRHRRVVGYQVAIRSQAKAMAPCGCGRGRGDLSVIATIEKTSPTRDKSKPSRPGAAEIA